MRPSRVWDLWSMASRLCLHHDLRIGERVGASFFRTTTVRASIEGRAYRRAGVTPSVRVMTRGRACSLLAAGKSLASSMRGFAIASSVSMSPLAPSAMIAARITGLTGSPSAAQHNAGFLCVEKPWTR